MTRFQYFAYARRVHVRNVRRFRAPPPPPAAALVCPHASRSKKKAKAERGGERGAWGSGTGFLAVMFYFCSHHGMAGRVGSIEDIAWRGHRLRLWCFGCGRWRTLDEGKVLQLFADRGWALDLEAARQRFPCRRCRSFAKVLILPARQLPPPPQPEPSREISWSDEVAGFFHANRALSKAKRKTTPPAFTKLLGEQAKKKGPGHRPDPRKKRIEDLD